MQVLFLFLNFVLFQRFTKSGHIHSYNIHNKWQNANYVQNIQLYFAVENYIEEDDYLKIHFPLSIGTVSASITGGNLNTKSLTATSNSNNDYFFKGVSLSANIIYTLEISVGTSPTTSGVKGVVKMFTVSDTSDDSIVYDSNEVFGIYSIAPSPSDKLVVGFPAATSTSINVPGGEYTKYIDFTLSVDSIGFQGINFNGGSQIIGNISDTSFKIKTCKFDSVTCLENSPSGCINITKPIDGSCSVNNILDSFTAFMRYNVVKDQKIRIAIEMKNSVKIGSATIDFYHTSLENDFIFELKKGNSLATVNPITVTVSSLKYLWGLASTMVEPCPLGVYQPVSSNAASSPVVNNLLVEFSPGTSLSGTEFGVTVYFGTTAKYSAILEGSIYHLGFSSVANGEITCSHNFPSSNTDFGVICRGIGSFNSSLTYSVGARVYTKPYTSGSDSLSSYPKVTIYTFVNNAASIISSVGSFSSYIFYKNADMTPFNEKNIGSFVDSNSRSILGHSWVFGIVKSSSTSTVTVSDQVKTLCLTEPGTSVSLIASSTTKNCTDSYKYGIFLEKNAADNPNSILLFINGASSNQGSFDSTVFPHAEFTANTHFAHKFILHKDFIKENSKQFGLNLIGGILGNTASDATAGAKDCSISGPNYCYPTFNADDDKFANGVSEIKAGNEFYYVVNYYDISNSNYAVITISCVVSITATGPTDAPLNCAFSGANRKIDTKLFPAFELTSDYQTIEKATKSSLYPDENVRDMVYCFWKIPFTEIQASKDVIIKKIELSNNNLSRKIQALLNFFHINIPISSTDVSSVAYIVNSACIEKTDNPTEITFNDENKIPIMMRVNYKIASELSSTYSAVAIFFGTKGNLQQISTGISTGMFSSANKPKKTTDLQPTDITSDINLLPSSNKVGSATTVKAYGYSLSGSTDMKQSDSKQWNYQPYILVKDGSAEIDMYVVIKKPSSVNTKALCANFFVIENLVVAFLNSKSTTSSFYDVSKAYLIYNTMKYGTSGHFSSKYSLKIEQLAADRTISGVGLKWDGHKLFDAGSCKYSNDLYPISTDYKIGVTTSLNISVRTGNVATCKNLVFVNGGYPASSFTFSYLTKGNSGAQIFNNIISSTSSFINISNCVQLGIASKMYSHKSIQMKRQIFVCAFSGNSDIDLNSNDISVEVGLANGVPWFWGANINPNPISILDEMVTFGWSVTGKLPLAMGQKYAQFKPVSVPTDSCITTSYSAIQLETSSQRIRWGLINQKADIVYPLLIPKSGSLITLSEQALHITDDISSTVAGNIIPHECEFRSDIFDCSLTLESPNLIYQLTPKTDSDTVIPKKSFTEMFLYASYNGATSLSGIKHKTKAYLLKNAISVNGGKSELMVLDCGTTGTDIPSSSSRSKVMKIDNILFSSQSNISSSFSVSFGYGSGISFFGSGDKVLVKTKILLGSLWNNYNSLSNMYCQVFNSSNIMSNIFQNLQFSSGTLILNPKTKKLESPGNFKVKCFGGNSPVNSSDPVQVQVLTGSVLQSASSSISIPAQSTLSQPIFKEKKVKFSSAGQSSIWEFKISFINSIVTGSSMVYVVFPISFSPKLSSQGYLGCLFNYTKVLCQFTEERRISLTPFANFSAGSVISIILEGIDMPQSYVSDTKIIIQLDSNEDWNDGIQEQLEIETQTISATTNSNPIIPLLYFDSISIHSRTTTHLRTYISLPSNTVVDNATIYYVLPSEFKISHIINSTIQICLFYNEYMDSLVNFASGCTKVSDRIIKFSLKVDSRNEKDSQIYRLQLGILYTPQYGINLHTLPTIFLSDSSESAITSFSNSGYANVTLPSFTKFSNPIVLSVQDENLNEVKEIVVYKGYFSSNLTVKYPNNEKSTGFLAAPSSNYSSNFVIWQIGNSQNQNIVMKSGDSSLNFFIAASENFRTGITLLKMSFTTSDTRTTDIPIIPIVLSRKKCVISPKIKNNFIPISNSSNTFSFPVVFEFSKCMPINDVGILTLVTESANGSFYLANDSVSLKNDYSGVSTQLLVIVHLKKGSVEGKTGTVNFSTVGTNKDSYIISPSTVSFVSKNISTALSVNFTGTSLKIKPSNGSVEFSINCNQEAIVYYYFGIGVSAINQTMIKSQTEDKGIENTSVNKSSSEAIKMGFSLQSNKETPVNITSVNDVKTREKYSFFAYCVNQANIVSEVITGNWTQSDYFPKVILVIVPLNATPGTSESKSILNKICSFIKASNEQVNDYKERKCSNIIMRQLQTSSSTNGDFNYTIFLQPDLFGASNDELVAKKNLLQGKSLSDLGVNIVSVTARGNISTSEKSFEDTAPSIISAIINDSYTKTNQTVLEIKTDKNCLLLACVYLNVAATSISPNITQLRIYSDAANTTCVASSEAYFVNGNSTVQVILGPFSSNTKYNVTFAVSTINLGSVHAKFSSLQTISFKSKNPNFGKRNVFYILWMIILILVN